MKPLVALLATSCVALAHAQFIPPGSQMAGMGAGSLGGGTSNVRFSTIARGLDGPGAGGFFVLQSPTQLDDYWQRYHKGLALPKLETAFFAGWRLVAIHLGSRPSGGYDVRVASILRSQDRMSARITALETVPPKDARVDRGATSPWVVLRVEQGAFGLSLQTRQAAGFAQGVTTVPGGTVIKTGGVTIITGGGDPYPSGGCDHCDHCGRDGCRCERGARGCDCKGR